MVQSIDEYRRHPSEGGRVPPHNLEAEESLLGAMMLSRDALMAAVEAHVGSRDFYKPAHGHIFDAALSLYGQGEPVDPVTVAEELRSAGLLDGVGGRAVILRIQAATPASANAAHYAQIVVELALLRRLIAVAGEIAELGYSPVDDVTEVLDRAESLVFEVADRRVSDTLVALYPALEQTMDQLAHLYERDGHLTGAATGYRDLDDLLLGLQPSNLIVVAARPGQGKTSFALGAATHVAIEMDKPVLFFSMEMDHLELTKRLLAAEARVDSRKLSTGRLTEAEWPKVNQAVGRLADARFFIDDNPHCTVMEMRAKARRTKALHGDIGLIVVDYLQLMSSGKKAESRQVEVSDLSRGLKILARELQTPVMTLSQLNRQLEYRQDKRPMLADLRESGCLTADTLVTRADTHTSVSMGELLESGETDVGVLTLDEHLRVVPGVISHVFASGVKPVFELRLASGRSVKASANHPFLTLDGWSQLGDLRPGSRLAVARHGIQPDAHADTIPYGVWDYIESKGLFVNGLRAHDLIERLAGDGGRQTAYRQGISRSLMQRIADELGDSFLTDLAVSDVFWDRVSDVVPLGPMPVFDATVPGTHNFVANGIVAHNSIEQDADVVLFIYRDEYYNQDSDQRGTAEIIVAKHRNGPVGTTRLAFLEQYTKFANMARE